MKFTPVPIPEVLSADIEWIRIGEHSGSESLAINVCPNGFPGLVFEHCNYQSPVKNIVTPVGVANNMPTLYVYGHMQQPSVMNYRKGVFKTIQIVLKPHALHSLFGLNASLLTNSVFNLTEIAENDLNARLIDAPDDLERIRLLLDVLLHMRENVRTRDQLVYNALHLIGEGVTRISVNDLLEHLHISERQFERRFKQVVGVSPKFYIRVRRFNVALYMIREQQFESLTKIAHALNYYDQSHFVRDIKAFSGTVPTKLLQKSERFRAEHPIHAYV